MSVVLRMGTWPSPSLFCRGRTRDPARLLRGIRIFSQRSATPSPTRRRHEKRIKVTSPIQENPLCPDRVATAVALSSSRGHALSGCSLSRRWPRCAWTTESLIKVLGFSGMKGRTRPWLLNNAILILRAHLKQLLRSGPMSSLYNGRSAASKGDLSY